MREFAFKHALTRDVAYGSLPRPERRDLHRQVAEWIQRVAPDRDVETAELAAYHYGEAIAYGEDDRRSSRRAVDSLLRAGRRPSAEARSSPREPRSSAPLRLSADDDQRRSALLALAELDATEARWTTRSGAPRRRSRSSARRTASRACARRCSRGARVSAGSRAAGRRRSLRRTAPSSALAGLPESPQLARALARRSQIEMLKHAAEAIAHARGGDRGRDRVGDSFAEVNARINLFTEQATCGASSGPDDVLDIVERPSRPARTRRHTGRSSTSSGRRSGSCRSTQIESVAAAGRKRPIAAAAESSGRISSFSSPGCCFVPAGRWAEADAILDGLDARVSARRATWSGGPTVGGARAAPRSTGAADDRSTS